MFRKHPKKHKGTKHKRSTAQKIRSAGFWSCGCCPILNRKKDFKYKYLE